MDAAAWGAVGTWFTFGVYVALLVYAIKQVGEAKKLRRSQTRPFVVVDVEPGFLLHLTIENIGSTLARNVHFSFTPGLSSTIDRPWEFEDAPLLRDGIASFPPRKRYRIFFDSFIDRSQRDDLPMEYTASATYNDDDGHEYTDHYTLNLKAILHTSPEEKGLPELVKEAEQIRKEISKWTDGTRGVLVHTRDKDQMIELRKQEIEEYRREREAQAESDQSPT